MVVACRRSRRSRRYRCAGLRLGRSRRAQAGRVRRPGRRRVRDAHRDGEAAGGATPDPAFRDGKRGGEGQASACARRAAAPTATPRGGRRTSRRSRSSESARRRRFSAGRSGSRSPGRLPPRRRRRTPTPPPPPPPAPGGTPGHYEGRTRRTRSSGSTSRPTAGSTNLQTGQINESCDPPAYLSGGNIGPVTATFPVALDGNFTISRIRADLGRRQPGPTRSRSPVTSRAGPRRGRCATTRRSRRATRRTPARRATRPGPPRRPASGLAAPDPVLAQRVVQRDLQVGRLAAPADDQRARRAGTCPAGNSFGRVPGTTTERGGT